MKIKRIATFMLCLALLITMGGSSLSPFFMKAEAATNKYSNVLDDLKKDKNFNPDDYPSDSTKNHLEVIQIAEGENGDLFIYVYQPGKYTKEYRAKYINMAREDMSNPNPKYNLYSLNFVNSNGVFEKYVVNNFVVSNETYRFYNIAAIYRAFDKGVDDKSEAVDGVACKAFSVGSVWCAYYYNNDIVYEHEKTNVVEISIYYADKIRYQTGNPFGYQYACDAHFIGFAVDNFSVDKIYDATIRYTYQEKIDIKRLIGNDETVDIENPVTVTKDIDEFDKAQSFGSGLFGKKYTWSRIQTVESFKQQADEYRAGISNEVLDGLNKCQFVFGFLETEYYKDLEYGSGIVDLLDADKYHYTAVTEIGVLRLHFLSEGKVYNLGAVSDLVYIDNDPNTTKDYKEEWQTLLSLVALIVVAVFLWPIISPIVSLLLGLLGKGLVFLVELLFSIITFPFRIFLKRKK